MLADLRRRVAGLILILALAAAGSVVSDAAAADGNRVALVIGNGSYGADIGSLRNPANDAKLMARSLKKLGFSVTLALDIDQKEMKRRIRDFGAALSAGGSQTVGLFYYAGHGVQVDGENFLLPIGAEIQREGDVSVEAVSANTVLAQMQYGNADGVNLVFLDACRNNPLSRSFRAATRGLARVDAPRGSFVGYSTAPGDVSVDGNGENSPYATALATEMLRPGEAIEEVHRAVRLQVLAATNQQQTPWDSSSLTATVTLAGPAQQALTIAPAPAPAPAPISVPASTQGAALDWENVKDSTNPAVFKAFLQQYPTGVYAALAQDKLDKLGGNSQQMASAAPEPAPQVVRTTPAQAPAPATVTTASAAAANDGTGDDNGIVPMEGAYLAAKSANIRAKPNSKGKILGRLKVDESVTVTGRTPDAEWFQVATGAGTGYVSAKLLKEDPTVAMPAPAPEPVSAPAPEPEVNVLRISEAFKDDIETFLSNSKGQKTSFRFLAVSEDGERIGISIGCKKNKVGWGGWAAEGCSEEARAKEIAIEKCGADCKIIFNGVNKVGEFEVEWQ